SGGACSGPVQVGPACQSNSPVRLLKPITVRRFSTAWVMKICSFQTIGVELPRSGSVTRQRTFSFVLHRKGRLASRQIPLPFAPRQAGQLSASARELRREMDTAPAAYVFSIERCIRVHADCRFWGKVHSSKCIGYAGIERLPSFTQR